MAFLNIAFFIYGHSVTDVTRHLEFESFVVDFLLLGLRGGEKKTTALTHFSHIFCGCSFLPLYGMRKSYLQFWISTEKYHHNINFFTGNERDERDPKRQEGLEK